MTKAANAEEALLGIAQINPDFLIKAINDNVLAEEDFKTEFNRRVYSALLECTQREGRYDLSFISDKFTPQETGRITRMLINRKELNDNSYKVFCEYAEALKSEAPPKQTGEAVTFDDLKDLINKKK